MPNKIKSPAMGFLLGTQERVWNSRGKGAISVWATEGLLYMCNCSQYQSVFDGQIWFQEVILRICFLESP